MTDTTKYGIVAGAIVAAAIVASKARPGIADGSLSADFRSDYPDQRKTYKIIEASEAEYHLPAGLLAQLGVNEEEEFDYMSLFEGDPDIIQMDGNRAGYFVELGEFGKKTTYVVYLAVEADDKKVATLLKSFFRKNYMRSWETVDHGTWKDFDNAKNAIAYRGGSGYHYTIWIKQ